MAHTTSLFGLQTLPLVTKGDDVGRLIVTATQREGIGIEEKDVLVVAQKIISKAEGATVDLKTVTPSPEAITLAKQTGRDARLCQVYLNEASEVLRVKGRMVITRHRLGFECSGSGVDRSNLAPHAEERVTLLPENPDQSAREIRDTIYTQTGCRVSVIVNDSFGRNDRDGSIGIAIGIAGIHHK